MISDNFLGNKPDLNRMFAEHCARRGWLKFGFGYAAMVREAKQFIARCVARGWCKFNPPKPQEVQAAIKSKRVFCSGGKTWHRYNRMGFCDVCGQERTRAPKKNFRAATQHRPTRRRISVGQSCCFAQIMPLNLRLLFIGLSQQ